MATKKRKSGFGNIRQLPSKQFQARFTGPDGLVHRAPTTFQTDGDAGAWLAIKRSEIVRSAWLPTTMTATTMPLAEYATSWLAGRDLKPRTRALYRALLDDHILPALGSTEVQKITPAHVRKWYAGLGTSRTTLRAHAYGLLRTIMATAVSEDLIDINPCRIEGGSTAKTKHRPRVATLPELEIIVEKMPPKYRMMVLLAAWCGLRFGELTELRRGDVDLADDVLRVHRGVTRAGGEVFIGDPKSEAGRRDVSIPPHLVPVLEEHLAEHVGNARNALLFPASHGGHLAPSTLYRVWYPARDAAGRSDLRFHDLRHTGATLAAATRSHAGGSDGPDGALHPWCCSDLPARRQWPRQGHRGGPVRLRHQGQR